MHHIQLYDPPLCCSTGVCGPSVDPQLIRVSSWLNQLKNHGVRVERFNLAQQPQAFADNAEVKAFLVSEGPDHLPLVFVDGRLVLKGSYPDALQRTRWLDEVRGTTPIPGIG
jgi:hypothetical protein